MEQWITEVFRHETPAERRYALGTLWRIALLVLVIVMSIVWGQAHAQTVWTQCAAENGICTFTGTKLVRYGEPFNNRWSPTRTMTSPVACNNTTFAPDPSPGTGKRCETMDAPVTTPPPIIPTPGTTVRVVSWVNPTQNTSGSPVCTITGTKVQASLQPDFAGWLQWDSIGSGTNIRITTVPNSVALYWRAATLCGTEASAWSTPTVRTEAEYAAANLPACAPYPIDPADKATVPYFSLRLKGGAIAWFCKLPDGTWKENGRWGPYDPTCIAKAFTDAQNPDAAAAKQALASTWSSCSVSTPADAEFKPLYDELVALNRPVTLPPVPQYVVAKNGAYPSRPVRAIVNGALGSQLSGRVAVGLPCDCSTFRSGDWCAVTGNENFATAATDQLPASAAVCSLKP